MIPVRIIASDNLTHDVKRFVTEKPDNYTFIPGQATEVAINKDGWIEEKRPFTFTSLPEDTHLEFIIKMYASDGVTEELHKLNTNDELLIGDAWGSISYQGPGYFIAGGAGVTPFIPILRKLEKEEQLGQNKLFFSNKTEKDIILEIELQQMLEDNLINIITREKNDKYFNGHINKDFLREHVEDFNKKFYVCGTMPLTNETIKNLKNLGVKEENIVYEK